MRGEYSRMGRNSPSELHSERDRVPWYYRSATVFLSWLALGGYAVFALVFTSDESNLRLSTMPLVALASSLLTLSYGGAVVAAVFSKSLLFIYDAILIPFLTASFVGAITIIMNFVLHKNFSVTNKALIYIPLVFAGGTTLTAAALAIIAWRRLSKIKRRDGLQTKKNRRWKNASMNSQYGDGSAAQELMTVNVREDEAQRQQLLRLLAQRDRAPSPDDRSSTYRIHLPGEDPGLKGPIIPPYARHRSDSAPSITNQWGSSNLLGRLSPDSDSQFEERERRRQEIEQGSITLTPSLDQSWPSTPNPKPAWLESVSSLRHAI